MVSRIRRPTTVRTLKKTFGAVSRLMFLFGGVAIFAGCATVPYNYLPAIELREDELIPLPSPQVERGEPNAFVDTLGFIFSIPGKILLLSWSVDSHDISPATEKALVDYLSDNNLSYVKVRLNQYAPGDEWTRLRQNQAVGAGWRYTVGVFNWLIYTILPGRVFGGDNFNTFTNTISLYSDNPAIALHEGGHAKDDTLTEWKGTYAVMRILPLVPLFQEADATSDTLGYYQDKRCRVAEKDGYNILYPAYATYVGGEIFRWVPGGLLLTVAAVIPGHIAGRIASSSVDDSDDSGLCASVNAMGDAPPEDVEATQSTDGASSSTELEGRETETRDDTSGGAEPEDSGSMTDAGKTEGVSSDLEDTQNNAPTSSDIPAEVD